MKLIGRQRERSILGNSLQSSEPEMISIIGRRRVGKTFLVHETYKNEIDFEISGLQHAEGKEQLRNFTQQLRAFFPKTTQITPPKDWLEAFFILIEHLKLKKKKNKMVVFLDEVPWLATHKSGFLQGLGYFWNSWAVKQQIVVVLCGSAASWMIQKILRNKGGLHNRVTKRIRLQPFTLIETKVYLKSRQVYFDQYQLLQLYMAIGGIPHYLKEVAPGKSATQNIQDVCFDPEGLLYDEFLSLYPALFDHADYHIAIIRALANNSYGLTRTEILKAAQLPDGGRVSKVIEELSESGFLQSFPGFGKRKKGKIYRLLDEYSLFYLRFIEKNKHDSRDTWHTLSQTQTYKIWCGYAFENICLKHIPQIKTALGIQGIHSSTSSFIHKAEANATGTQIDLVIDRNDHIINLVEVKFYNTAFTISKSYAEKLREKMRVFQEVTKSSKQLVTTLITTFGLKANKHSIGLVQQEITSDDLFQE